MPTRRKGKSDEIERISGIGGPDDYCVLCEHNHKNENCFKQHPERKKSSGQKGKSNSKGKENGIVSKVFLTMIMKVSLVARQEIQKYLEFLPPVIKTLYYMILVLHTILFVPKMIPLHLLDYKTH